MITDPCRKKHIRCRLLHVCGMAVLMATALLGSGCSIITIDTMKNKRLDPGEGAPHTRASERVGYDDLANGVFIGIAMSGGGVRASNLSAAVLLELEKLGILRNATAISSVSGSSVTAAYYGLYGEDKEERWRPEMIRTLLRTDFESQWIWRWFSPHNALRYWTTNFSRSDIMKQVLDSDLYDGKAFGEMPHTGPRILLNATSINAGNHFIFSDERFAVLASRLDSYPVSSAVMASSAFPGVFHDMTLKDYSGSSTKQKYEHLIDGGPFDNLGITSLLDMARRLYRPSHGGRGASSSSSTPSPTRRSLPTSMRPIPVDSSTSSSIPTRRRPLTSSSTSAGTICWMSSIST